MGQATLVGMQVDDGERLIEALDARGHKVVAALWLRNSDTERWELRIVLDGFDPTVDPRVCHRRIGEVFWSMKRELSFDQSDIRLVGPDNSVIEALRHSVLAQAASVSRAHLGGRQLGKEFVEDAYLYRIG